jgi:hypothetical protein
METVPFFAWDRAAAGRPDDRHILAVFATQSQFARFAPRPIAAKPDGAPTQMN